MSRLSCTASAAVRSISTSTAKTAAQPRLPALPAQLARQAGRYWLSICRSTAPGKNSPEKLVPWVVTRELQAVYARMHPVWKHIRVYGVSIGAWFAMQALQTQKPEKALLVSPIVDMEKLILALMQQAGVTEEQLHAAGEIPTDFGETLSWPYLCWVREHSLHWKVPTQVLYADTDPLTGHTAMEQFRQQTGAHLTILEGGEHWFHTETQLAALQSWESCHL